jgi:hypothetical protein
MSDDWIVVRFLVRKLAMSTKNLSVKMPFYCPTPAVQIDQNGTMDRLRRFSLYLWLTLRHMRPVSLGRLIMPCVFITCWMCLRALEWPEAVAFVWAGALAQVAQIWSALPVTVARQRTVFGRARGSTSWAVTFMIGFLAVQIWWSDPWMSQRLVTCYCALYAFIMALGVWGDTKILDRFAYAPPEANVPLELRRHLLKLYALVAILVILVNEALLLVDAPLNARVTTFALLPIALHFLFSITLLLTAPILDDNEA